MPVIIASIVFPLWPVVPTDQFGASGRNCGPFYLCRTKQFFVAFLYLG